MHPRPEVRWHTTRHPLAVGPHTFDLTTLDGFESNVAWDAQRRRGRPDPRDGADISPMFGVIWPGARTLAHRLLEVPGLARLRVLELGCGLALPSLVAARAGAQVVATDVHPDAGDLLRANLRQNRLDGQVTWARWDWRHPPPEAVAGRFDLVLASDVLYDGALAAPLAATFHTHLGPDGEAWLTDPGRPWIDDFLDAARALGLQVEEDLSDRHGDVVHLVRLRHRPEA